MIPIRNIYYMLSYAFQILQEKGYKSIATEQFDNIDDLYASILIKGISLQLKRGIHRDYIEKTESLSSPHGQIDISASIKTRSLLKSQLVCTFDEFSENSYLNRILKTTMGLLLKSDIAKERKKEIRRLLVYFNNVNELDIYKINWKIRYNKNNKTYHLLIAICNLFIMRLIHTQVDGTTKVMTFMDEQRMCRLYEKFILEYYRKHYPEISANAEQISWQLDDGVNDQLPIMQSDIMLKKGNTVLIIDAKYYTHTMQTQYESHTLHSANLYQIFTYVKNKENELKDVSHRVSGMLLYARTDEMVQPNNTYQMSGNQIDVKTLNLDCDFSEIAGQLNKIVEDFFGR